MSKTYLELEAWASSQDAIRVILVEIEDVNGGTVYLSNKSYTTEAGDTPASVSYTACLVGALNFTESLDISGGTSSIGYGTIDVNNLGGLYDFWLDYVWKNKRIQIFLGDPRWARDDFVLIFTGLVDDVTSSERDKVSLSLYNKLEVLNTSISEKTLTSLYPTTEDELVIGVTPQIAYTSTNAQKPVGAVQNRDRVLPLCFGECFNVTPLKISSALSGGATNVETFMVHDGPIEAILEVRDNGVPLSSSAYSVNLSTGTFTLNNAAYGSITCDVQGAKVLGVFLSGVGQIIKHLVTTYGSSTSPRYELEEIDTDLLDTYDEYKVGVYIVDRENVFDVCQRIANSVGASLSQTYGGLLVLGRVAIPGFEVVVDGIVTDITERNTLFDGISISSRPVVKGAIKLSYAKNYTVQSEGVAGAVPSSNVDLYKKTSLYITQKDDVVITAYKQTGQPLEEQTLLISEAQAVEEAQRRLELFKVPRSVLQIQGRMEFTTLTPGMAVTVTNYRFGLSDPTDGVVLSTSKDWVTGKTTIGVLI